MNELLLDYFDDIIGRTADVPRLNEAILQLAVRGKLVAQDPADEPAAALLRRIATEKKRLGIKSKKLPEIGEEERPYPLPDGWEWARFGQIVEFSLGKTPPTKEQRYWDEAGTYWVSISDMEQYGTVTETTRKVSDIAVEKVFRGKISPKGTLLMSFKLTLGKVSRLGVDAFHNEAIISIFPYKGVSQNYLFRFLPVFVLFGKSKDAIKGSTLNSKSLTNLPIPLPPLAEQKRIVARVDELLTQTRALANRLAEAEANLTTLHETAVFHLLHSDNSDDLAAHWQFIADNFDLLYDERYPDAALANVAQLKQAILQLAVRGKLTRQDPNDEPAAALLRRIAAEKKRLVRETNGRIEKSFIEIEDYVYPIPSNWEWVHVGQVCPYIVPNRDKPKTFSGSIPWITLPDFDEEELYLSGSKSDIGLTKQEVVDSRARLIPAGSVIMSCVGRFGIIGILTREAVINQQLHAFVTPDGIDSRYLAYALKTQISYMENQATSTTILYMNKTKCNSVPLPLPPLAEQKRIVARVEALLRLCDDLTGRITVAKETGDGLKTAVLGSQPRS
jgi:type I restriction enzyme, S subunit